MRSDGMRGRAYPPGPRVYFPLALAAQLLPRLLPFDPLVFNVGLRQYGDVAYYHVGPLKVYQLNHPELARQILVEHPEDFQKPRFLKRAFRPFAGSGLLTSDGDLWKRQRRLIQPAFHHKHLATYAEVMVGHTLLMLESWRNNDLRAIDADMMALTLGIVVKSLFGADLERGIEDLGSVMAAVLEASNKRLTAAFQIPDWVPTARNVRERRALARLDSMLHGIIEARRASNEAANDLLSILLKAADAEGGVASSAQMSDQQLRDEMMTLFLAGHETTANLLTWTWYLLSRYPEVEARLLEELGRVLKGAVPTVGDLPNLPYLEMVIREVLRLYPPAPGFTREPIEDVSLGGYEIPKGSLVTVMTYALHRDERFFDDPERFDPERFAPGWEDRIHRFAYLPFGGGPRVCIGNGFAMMEARLVVATVAARYALRLAPNQEVVPVQRVTVRPKQALRMAVTIR